jgi:hypothetical protein
MNAAGEDERWILREASAEGNDRASGLRVLGRMLNMAVRKKFLFANPCTGIEFPARVDRLFRPH